MTTLTASKPWACGLCGRVIEPGDDFVMDDGDMLCEECYTDPANDPALVVAAMTAR